MGGATEFELGTLEILEEMANSLNELNDKCEKTADLRNVFDDIKEPIYFDYIHVSDKGHEIIAKRLLELSIPIVLEDLREQ